MCSPYLSHLLVILCIAPGYLLYLSNIYTPIFHSHGFIPLLTKIVGLLFWREHPKDGVFLGQVFSKPVLAHLLSDSQQMSTARTPHPIYSYWIKYNSVHLFGITQFCHSKIKIRKIMAGVNPWIYTGSLLSDFASAWLSVLWVCKNSCL